jgi:hypothetical protein
MATWERFESLAPDLAAFGRERIQRTGVTYLATVRADGGPRVHPVTPVFAGGRMWIWMEPSSPKRHDVLRDPRYAMHAAVEGSDGGGGEFVLRGRARASDDPQERALVAGPNTPDRYVLFELGIDEVMASRYVDHDPVRDRWRDDEAR